MLAEKFIRRILHHTYAIILVLSDYPQEKIEVFIEGHLIQLQQAPISALKQEMIDDILAVFDPFDKGRLSKTSDKKKRTTDISVIKENEQYIIKELNEIINQVNTISHTNKSILKEFGLNEKSSFYNGSQHDILEKFKVLKYDMNLNTDFVSVMPQVTTLCKYVADLYKIKAVRNSKITFDETNVKNLIDPISKALLINFCKLNIEYNNSLNEIPPYFPVALLDLSIKDENLLAVNQYKVTGYQGTAINVINAEFENNYYLQADCRKCNLDAYIFLASEITDVIPLNAQKVCKGDRLIFKFDTIGSSTQKYLMIVFAKDETVTEACNFIITIDKKKPQRKNIVASKLATPAPIVVVTPEATGESTIKN